MCNDVASQWQWWCLKAANVFLFGKGYFLDMCFFLAFLFYFYFILLFLFVKLINIGGFYYSTENKL
jgi:hypothetical protein